MQAEATLIRIRGLCSEPAAGQDGARPAATKKDVLKLRQLNALLQGVPSRLSQAKLSEVGQ